MLMDAKEMLDHPTILVVDDDYQVLEMLLLLLSEHGFKVVTAKNAAEALTRLDDKAVEVVLTDIKMPGMDGIELAGRIHESEPDLPVLIMTAYADVEVAVGALKRGAFDFILKPVNKDHLIHSLAKAAMFSQMKRHEKTTVRNSNLN